MYAKINNNVDGDEAELPHFLSIYIAARELSRDARHRGNRDRKIGTRRSRGRVRPDPTRPDFAPHNGSDLGSAVNYPSDQLGVYVTRRNPRIVNLTSAVKNGGPVRNDVAQRRAIGGDRKRPDRVAR